MPRAMLHRNHQSSFNKIRCGEHRREGEALGEARHRGGVEGDCDTTRVDGGFLGYSPSPGRGGQPAREFISEGGARVSEHIYLKDHNTGYNKLSTSEQAMKELGRLVDVYMQKGEDMSISMTSHSLGDALALLSAYEVAAKGLNSLKTDLDRNVPMTVFSFGAPRVGNSAFKDRLEAMGVKVLCVVSEQDMVPKMPGIIFNEGMEKFKRLMKPLLDRFPWTYAHVGVEIKLDHGRSPSLKENLDPADYHNLEGYLHLLDGYESWCTPFRSGDAKRDVALVNKAFDMLRPELMVAGNWYQLDNKGLVCNSYGRWVQPEREAEGIPSHNHVLVQESLGFKVPI